jgi:hypothetical protein
VFLTGTEIMIDSGNKNALIRTDQVDLKDTICTIGSNAQKIRKSGWVLTVFL